MKIIIGIVTASKNDDTQKNDLYKTCDASWSFYLKYFSDIDFYFLRWTSLPQNSKFILQENNLTVELPRYLKDLEQHYDSPQSRPGEWSKTELRAWNERQLSFFEYCHQNYVAPYWIFLTSTTSLVDVLLLKSFTEPLNPIEIYGGAPVLNDEHNLFYAQGAGTLLSSDLISTILARRELVDLSVSPDLWLGLVLDDIPRLLFPQRVMTFSKGARPTYLDIMGVVKHVSECSAAGIFNYRFNSMHPPINMDRRLRKEVDPILHIATASALLDNVMPRGGPSETSQLALLHVQHSERLSQIEISKRDSYYYYGSYCKNEI
jgi:hypothetical protein